MKRYKSAVVVTSSPLGNWGPAEAAGKIGTHLSLELGISKPTSLSPP